MVGEQTVNEKEASRGDGEEERGSRDAVINPALRPEVTLVEADSTINESPRPSEHKCSHVLLYRWPLEYFEIFPKGKML
jgi:hypothetical protein